MRPIYLFLLAVSLCTWQAAAQNSQTGKESTSGTRDEPAPGIFPNEPANTNAGPHTEMTDTTSPKASADPLLDTAPLPEGGVTLIGGTAKKVDRVRNRIELLPFGDKKSMWVSFDERSHIFRDGRETTILGVKPGDRIYVDTQTLGPRVFARNVRVQSTSAVAQATGQIVEVNEERNIVWMTDAMTGLRVVFRLTPNTAVKPINGVLANDYLRPGTVVSVAFSPASHGAQDASEVQVLAVPGMMFSFAGRVSYIDLRTGTIAVDNDSDGKNYQLQLDLTQGANREALKVGCGILAKATFDGKQYMVQNFSVTAPPVASEQ